MTTITCAEVSAWRPAWNNAGEGRVVGFSGTFAQGEVVGIYGPDGCGKGLLLNLLGLIERPDTGVLQILGHDAQAFNDEDLATFRNEVCGYLFGHPYLLPSFSVAENVAMPYFRICGGDASEVRSRTVEMLAFCGIADYESSLAGRIPVSVRWRAALARALVHEPEILIAISPPAPELLGIARMAAESKGLTIIWAGDYEDLAPHATRLVGMSQGVMTQDLL